MVVAVAAFFLLYDFPETATFLTEEERAFVVFRLKYQGQETSKKLVSSEAGSHTTKRRPQQQPPQSQYPPE